ncbi:MAG TPA: thiamine diphosphokinase [Atopostipes sp.]|nr:thiamine diphosphokinase [Atopostipes sp.]
MDTIHIILGAPKQEEIKPLMDDKGLVIGVDRGGIYALEEEIKVDIALGDFDSMSIREKEILTRNVSKIRNYPADKDDTDTEIALLYVLENYPEAKILIYNWYGGRIDHLYSLFMLVLQKRFQPLVPKIRFISEKNHLSFYLPGEHIINKIGKMNYLSYILLTKVKNLTLKDVKYVLSEENFEQPQALISNEFLSEQARFSFSKGIIGVIQSRD